MYDSSIYDPPIIKNGVKIYRLRYAYKKRNIITFVCVIIFSYLMILGMSLNAKSPADNIFAWVICGSLILYTLWIVYQSIVFRLELTEQGGILYGLGKTIGFEWQAVHKLDYIDWLD